MQHPERVDQFLRIYTREEPRIFAYILALLPNWTDAEDVLQETSTVLWSKFDQFQPGSSFFAWACQIARFEVQRFQRTRRPQQLAFDDIALELLAQETILIADELESRQQALAECVEKLPPETRQLLTLWYERGATGADVSEQLGCSIHMVYKTLKLTRRTLLRCVKRALAEERS